MPDLVDTTEMYLKAVIELEEEGVVPLRARIAERLEQAGPTVSQTVGRMERDRLVVVSDDRHLQLTETGRRKAIQVMRKHRLAERFLDDVVGLDWEFVHEEACRLEHVMSERVERRLLDVLDHPTHSPYGNVIPGLEELGETSVSAGADVVNLVRLVANTDAPDRDAADRDAAVEATVCWIGEPAQVDPPLLRRLRRAGILPGARGTFSVHGPAVLVRMNGEDELELPHDIAAHVFVAS